MTNDSPICKLCGPYDDLNFEQHKNGLRHRFNFLLWDYNENRNLNNVHDGITIKANLEGKTNNINSSDFNNNGIFYVKLSPLRFSQLNNQLVIKISVQNCGKIDLHAVCCILHPYKAFEYASNQNIFQINKGECCDFLIKFKLDVCTHGSYKIPIAIALQPTRLKDAPDRTIYKDIVIYITDDIQSDDKVEESPFKMEKFKINIHHPPTDYSDFLEFMIPDEFIRAFRKDPEQLSYEERTYYNHYMDVLKKPVTIDTYVNYFKYLLWLDEFGSIIGLQQYNMSNVLLNICYGDVMLEVPGLTEKRPSIVAGDLIEVSLPDDEEAYQGVIHHVDDENVFVKDFSTLLYDILQMYANGSLKFNVRFKKSRMQHERLHKSIRLCATNYLTKSLFPVRPLNRPKMIKLKYDSLINKTIYENKEQLTAVRNILSRTSFHAPYIIYGPPGTGKSITLIEAVLQIKRLYKDQRILICASSNAACDVLASKLIEHCTTDELIRIYSSTRTISDVPNELIKYSNFEGAECVRSKLFLSQKRIVVATLVMIGKFAGHYAPDCLFIDEAAQATEPECCVAISLLKPMSLIVIAGDPRQLGPVTESRLAHSLGLGVSLLDRLMETVDLYQPTKRSPLMYDDHFITMLVQNYRSHENIVLLSNHLFYQNSLTFKENLDPLCDVFISPLVCNQTHRIKMGGNSIEFCGVLSKEARQGASPSYFNTMELNMVMKYVDILLSDKLRDIKVIPSDIGIIAPYIRQVGKLKKLLDDNDRYKGIEVGTTETYQGKEKRIIIISTVRAQHSLLKYDNQYKLGFISNERRFNVALTRAQSKLIIIGNPFVLLYDEKCWMKYIDFCEYLNAYFGVEYLERNESVMQQIMTKINKKKRK